LTTNLIDEAEPLRLRVTARASLQRDSDLLVDQSRAIANVRLASGPLARLDPSMMDRVAIAIRELLDTG